MTFHHALTKRHVQRPAHARARLSRFIVALLLYRIVNVTTGCGPSDGENGGDCIPPKDSCRQDPYCNPGLRCEYDNVCRPDESSTSYPADASTNVVHVTPAPRCVREANPRCGAPAEGWTCRYGSPEDAGDCLNVLLADASTPGEGYCCAPRMSCDTSERSDDAGPPEDASCDR